MNTAKDWGVVVREATHSSGQECIWRASLVRHLSGNENQGKHNIFINALDENTEGVVGRGYHVRWGWEGQRPDEASPSAPLDKSGERYMADIPIFKGQKIWIEMDDSKGTVSDRVEGFSTDFEGDEPGNSYGHHSYSVIFLLECGDSNTDPPPDPKPTPSKLPTPPYIYGVHDIEGYGMMKSNHIPGWIVPTVALSENPPSISMPVDDNIEAIVRLNWGYGRTGTIPLPNAYSMFAERCAGFVEQNPAFNRWIIGNEPNLAAERPGGVFIRPDDYVACFRRCRAAIRAVQGHEKDEVILAAIGPWNIESGDWIDYFRHVLINSGCDGIALHTYTHGADPRLIVSNERMDAPYADRFFQFRAYQDFLKVVPSGLRHLPVYITETNQNDAWLDDNNGWVRAAYREIDLWNSANGTQKIMALCLYRWPRYDKYYIEDKDGVIQDLREAAGKRYAVPVPLPKVGTVPDNGEPTPVDPPVEPARGAGRLAWPLKGFVTQRFGENREYYLKTFGQPGHSGLDIAAPLGTPVVSPADGEVMWVGTDVNYGNYARIFYPQFGFHGFFAHLDSYSVAIGQQVKKGQEIGKCGSTGNSTAPHLHYETRVGTRDQYAQGAYGHTKGKIDPEAAFYLLNYRP